MQHGTIENDDLFDYTVDGWKNIKDEALPKLVLGLRCEPKGRLAEQMRPNFAPGRVWHPICHTTGGTATTLRYLWATFIEVAPDRLLGMKNLCNVYYNSQISPLPRLSTLLEYQATLTQLIHPYASCERSYPDFEEGYYPLDSSCLRSIATGDALSIDLDNLILPRVNDDWISQLHRFEMEWSLAILGANSD